MKICVCTRASQFSRISCIVSKSLWVTTQRPLGDDLYSLVDNVYNLIESIVLMKMMFRFGKELQNSVDDVKLRKIEHL